MAQETAFKNFVRLSSGAKIDIDIKELKGQISRMRYKSDTNGFVVFSCNGVNCVGIMPDAKIGINVKLFGSLHENKKYNNWDFKFEKYETEIEEGAGIISLLSREAPGIGPGIAARIISVFGDDTLSVITKDCTRLTQIPGITAEKARTISDWANKEIAVINTKQKLYKIGLMPAQVSKVIIKYGADAERKIKIDCFSLTEIHGFGFKTVASIADMLGIPEDDPGRIKAAIHYATEELCESHGHTCIKSVDLIRKVCELTGVHQGKITPLIEQEIASQSLVTEKTDWEELLKESDKEAYEILTGVSSGNQ
jgi:exodeoxyribonuclease V alpha subunit